MKPRRLTRQKSYSSLSLTTSEGTALEGCVPFQAPTAGTPPGKAGVFPLPYTAAWAQFPFCTRAVTNAALHTTRSLEFRGNEHSRVLGEGKIIHRKEHFKRL